MTTLPTLFLSHGAPDVAIAPTPANAFLRTLAGSMSKPEAIVVASAHFEASGEVQVTSDANPETIHDFGGFDRRLHEMHYRAPGHPALAAEIVGYLEAAGLRASTADDRGFDHGAWVPLVLAYPHADIPVVEISIDPAKGPAHHLAVGSALTALRARGVLVIGSGSFTHNLPHAFQNVRAGHREAETPDWVRSFADWMSDRITVGDTDALLNYRDEAPFAVENHPTDEHLLPLYVAIGAAGENTTARRLHASQDFGVLSMAAFAFD